MLFRDGQAGFNKATATSLSVSASNLKLGVYRLSLKLSTLSFTTTSKWALLVFQKMRISRRVVIFVVVVVADVLVHVLAYADADANADALVE